MPDRCPTVCFKAWAFCETMVSTSARESIELANLDKREDPSPPPTLRLGWGNGGCSCCRRVTTNAWFWGGAIGPAVC